MQVSVSVVAQHQPQRTEQITLPRVVMPYNHIHSLVERNLRFLEVPESFYLYLFNIHFT